MKMEQLTLPPRRSTYWLNALLASKAAREGAVVRRKCEDVHRVIDRDTFLQEMRERGFSVVENSGQYVVFCNAMPLTRLT